MKHPENLAKIKDKMLRPAVTPEEMAKLGDDPTEDLMREEYERDTGKNFDAASQEDISEWLTKQFEDLSDE